MSSCYKYFNHQSRWTDARNLCQNISADLAKITSRDVHDFVFGLGSHQPFDVWIGLRQLGTRFVWTDGSRIGNFSFWLRGEPLARPGQDVCVEMLRNDNDGRWGTGKCTVKHSSYVCQKGAFAWVFLTPHIHIVQFEILKLITRVIGYRKPGNESLWHPGKDSVQLPLEFYKAMSVSQISQKGTKAAAINF